MDEAEQIPTFDEALAELPTDRRRLFVRLYMVTLIGSHAAKDAGYAEGSAEQEASRLLRDVKVRAAVDAGLRQLADDAHISRAWVLQRLKLNAIDAHDKGELQASTRALTTIAKYLGMLDKDLNINLTGDATARVVMYFPENERGPKPKGTTDGDDDEKAGV